MNYKPLSQITKLDADKFSKKAPIIKILLIVAIISQVISMGTEAFGMHTFFKQFMTKYADDNTISIVIDFCVVLLLLFIATFFFGILKVKSFKKRDKVLFFLITAGIVAGVIHTIDFNAGIIGASIGVMIAILMEILIRALTIYICWEILTFTVDEEKITKLENFGNVVSVLVALVILGFVTDFSVNTSKKATHHAFWHEKPERKQADLTGITAVLNRTKATNKRDYSHKSNETKQISQKQIQAVKDAHQPNINRLNNDVAYWEEKNRRNNGKYINEVRRRKNAVENAEKAMQEEVKTLEAALATSLSTLLNEYQAADKLAQSDFDKTKVVLKQDATAGTADTEVFFRDLSEILAAIGGYSVLLSIGCYFLVILNLRLIGVKPSISPSKEFFEGNVGGFFRELWQLILLKTVRDLRNAIRGELGQLGQLAPIDAKSGLFVDWQELKEETNSVENNGANTKGNSTKEQKRSKNERSKQGDDDTTRSKNRSNDKRSKQNVENTTRSKSKSVENRSKGSNGVATPTTQDSTDTTTVVNKVVVNEGMPSVVYNGKERSEAWIKKQINDYKAHKKHGRRNPETCDKNIETFNKLLEDIEQQKKGEFLGD